MAEDKRIDSNLAKLTRQASGHLMSRLSILLQRGLASLLVHRIPCRP